MNSHSCFEGFTKIIDLHFQKGLLNNIGSTAIKLQYTVQYLIGHVESPCLAVLPVYTWKILPDRSSTINHTLKSITWNKINEMISIPSWIIVLQYNLQIL